MSEIALTIDGQQISVQPGTTVLEACQKLGIRIPTLCYHQALPGYGACRLCLVEVEEGGRCRTEASCIFPAHPPKETFPALGATAGVIGSIQAGEVIKYLTGTGTLLTDRLLLWNGADATCDLLPAPREPACPVCSHLYTTEDTSQ